MEEYIRALLSQVRCKKAHPAIEGEVRGHIEDQRECYQKEGMAEDEVMRRAVADMGDPVEAGIALDGIHRPKMAWDMILLMAAISAAGLAVHMIIGVKAGDAQYCLNAGGCFGIGFMLMCLVCRMDYSALAKHGNWLAVLFLAGMLIWNAALVASARLVLTNEASKGAVWIRGDYFLWESMLFLYVPLYAAALYRLRGNKRGRLIQALLLLFLPLFLLSGRPVIAMVLAFVLSALLSSAVLKGWFAISKKGFLTAYWGAFLALPAACLTPGVRDVLLTSYQRDRLLAMLSGSPKGVAGQFFAYRQASRLLGAGGEAITEQLQGYNGHYILTYLSGSYGVAIAVLACVFICFIAAKVFRISFRQGNQLGRMIGLGSSLTLFINVGLNVCENFGLLPVTGSYFPFFSYTGGGIIVSYVLVGLALSVYRYQNVLPASTYISKRQSCR